MELFETVKQLGESGYIFRITDNGGESADRLTVIFCDGDHLGMSYSPSHPQGVSMWGEGIDVAAWDERVTCGQEVDLQLGDLPEHLQKHILGRVNEGWRDFLELIEARDPSAVAPTREKAEVHEGISTSGGKGIYAAGDGFCVRTDRAYPDNAAEDRGPFLTAREALAATLPEDYALSGPEYHATVAPGSLKRSGQLRKLRTLERKREKDAA